MEIWNKLSGWKTVIAYVLMSIPGLASNPMLLGAIKTFMDAPTEQGLINLVTQLILGLGIFHRIVKNVSGSES